MGFLLVFIGVIFMCSDMLPAEHDDELLFQTDDESLTASLVSKENWNDEEMNKGMEEGNTTRTNTPSNSLLSEEHDESLSESLLQKENWTDEEIEGNSTSTPPNKNDDEDQSISPMMIWILFTKAGSASTWTGMDVTLASQLENVYKYTNAMIGATFNIPGLVYLCLAFPIGMIVDRFIAGGE
jgi:hypothetical protein